MAVGGKALSVSLVGIVAGAIATAIGMYIHLEVQARTAAKEEVLRHEAKRIKDAHADAIGQNEHQRTQHDVDMIRRDVGEVKQQQTEAIQKIDVIRRMLRRDRSD